MGFDLPPVQSNKVVWEMRCVIPNHASVSSAPCGHSAGALCWCLRVSQQRPSHIIDLIRFGIKFPLKSILESILYLDMQHFISLQNTQRF